MSTKQTEALALVNKVDQEESLGTEQPAQQEPVAWMQNTTAGLYVIDHCDEWHCIPLYTSPPAQQEPVDKSGSPCPKFWDWLPKAYDFEGLGNFTKYDMEVAFLAGKQSVPAQQEPVAAECKFDREEKWVRCEIAHHNLVQSEPEKWPGYQTRLLYTSPQPPQRTWVGLTDEERDELWYRFGYMELMRAVEAKLKEKNT